MNFSFYDVRRKAVRLKQAGRGGGGTVLHNKGVIALVVKRTHFTGLENDPVDIKAIRRPRARRLDKRIHDLDDKQCTTLFRRYGPPYRNQWTTTRCCRSTSHRFGRHKDINNISSESYIKLFTRGNGRRLLVRLLARLREGG